jgi:hypothetical protein
MRGAEVQARMKAQTNSESQNRVLWERNTVSRDKTAIRITSLPLDYKLFMRHDRPRKPNLLVKS